MQTLTPLAFLDVATPETLKIVFDGSWRVTCPGALMLFADGSSGKRALEEVLTELARMGVRRCDVEWDGFPTAQRIS